jgi:hypothetical protein
LGPGLDEAFFNEDVDSRLAAFLPALSDDEEDFFSDDLSSLAELFFAGVLEPLLFGVDGCWELLSKRRLDPVGVVLGVFPPPPL